MVPLFIFVLVTNPILMNAYNNGGAKVSKLQDQSAIFYQEMNAKKLLETVSILFEGKLNILVNSAAAHISKKATDYTAEDCRAIMGTNFEASYHLCQKAYPSLKASGNGSIVFISSIAGVIALPALSIYAAFKGTLNQLAKNLACEWAKDNIHVNAIAPGLVKTNMVKHLLEEDPSMKEFGGCVIARTPAGRAGRPEEVSSLVAFLCFPAASC